MREPVNDELRALHLIRKHISASQLTPGGSTPLPMARWLSMQYAKLPGALSPEPLAPMPVQAFDQLSGQDKLNRLHAEFTAAEGGNVLDASVPTPWAAWLLEEFDRLGSQAEGGWL